MHDSRLLHGHLDEVLLTRLAGTANQRNERLPTLALPLPNVAANRRDPDLRSPPPAPSDEDAPSSNAASPSSGATTRSITRRRPSLLSTRRRSLRPRYLRTVLRLNPCSRATEF